MIKMRISHFLAPLALGFILVACNKVENPVVQAPTPQPIVMSNKDEPVIFNGQKFLISFEYKPAAAAYDVAVRRTARPLRDRESDRKDAEQVAKSALTHYACPGSTKARRLDEQVALNRSGEWRSMFRCA